MLLLLLGCSSSTFLCVWREAPPSVPQDGRPSLHATPGVFEAQAWLGESRLVEVQLHNLGDGDLHIQELVPGPGLSLESSGDLGLAPAESSWLQLRWTFDQLGGSESFLEIHSDDLEQSVLVLPFYSEVDGPQLSARVDELEPLVLGCSGATWLVLDNLGNTELTVSDLELPEELALAWEVELPLLLEPDQTWATELIWTPLDHGPWTGELRVHSDDPLAPQTQVRIEGRTSPADRSERFELEAYQVDILLSRDWSCSHCWHAVSSTGWADEPDLVDDFLSDLGERGIDYRMAITLRGACLPVDPMFVDPTTSLHERLGILDEQHCQSWSGTSYCDSYGGDTESPLAMMRGTVALDAPGACNEGLLRDEADLVLIAVSDEPDQSPGYWMEHAEALIQAAGEGDLNAYSLAGVVDGCKAWEPMGVWQELIDRVGGQAFDLCKDDQRPSWERLAEGVDAQSRRIYLEGRPQAETLVVLLDGQALEAWSYDPTDNTVVLDERPARGDLEVRYAEDGACF